MKTLDEAIEELRAAVDRSCYGTARQMLDVEYGRECGWRAKGWRGLFRTIL